MLQSRQQYFEKNRRKKSVQFEKNRTNKISVHTYVQTKNPYTQKNPFTIKIDHMYLWFVCVVQKNKNKKQSTGSKL